MEHGIDRYYRCSCGFLTMDSIEAEKHIEKTILLNSNVGGKK